MNKSTLFDKLSALQAELPEEEVVKTSDICYVESLKVYGDNWNRLGAFLLVSDWKSKSIGETYRVYSQSQLLAAGF